MKTTYLAYLILLIVSNSFGWEINTNSAIDSVAIEKDNIYIKSIGSSKTSF